MNGSTDLRAGFRGKLGVKGKDERRLGFRMRRDDAHVFLAEELRQSQCFTEGIFL